VIVVADNKTRITISLDEDVARKADEYAEVQRTTVSRLINWTMADAFKMMPERKLIPRLPGRDDNET